VDVTISLSSNHPALTVPASVVIPAGSLSVVIPAVILDNAVISGPQTATVTAIAPGWLNAFASLTIEDNEANTLILSLPSTLAEGDTAQGTATLGTASTTPVRLTFTTSGARRSVSTVVIIPAGQLSAPITLTAPNDDVITHTASLIVTATPPAGYIFIPATATGTVLVTDNELTTLSFGATSARSAFEGGTLRVIVKLSAISLAAVPFQITSSLPDEIETFSGTVPAGSSTAAVTLSIEQDSLVDGASVQTLTLTGL
jgi:hypothetical protein